MAKSIEFQNIIDAIHNGYNTFGQMCVHFKYPNGPAGWRQLDGQLQRMRRKKLIKFNRGTRRWEVC